ncbi:hypothetical protein ACFYTQ_26445 [Nocardia sp. NPDC004068]|uniref:hypothetical protein n=1 Tax=Nocardia sp. NPDC004068 TaxID=3364303 RepID=UPI0036CF1C54
MSDDQIGFDIEFDEKTQAWLDWVAPERMESQIRKLLAETVPGIADYSDAWWKPPVLTHVLEAAAEVFGDAAGFASAENRDRADQLVRFLGECCIRQHPGMTWTNNHKPLTPLYSDFGPAVHYAETGIGTTISFLTNQLFRKNLGPRMVEYCIRKAGTPA